MLDAASKLIALKNDRRGVTAVEYGIIAALMSAALVIAFTALGGDIKTAFGSIGTTILGAT